MRRFSIARLLLLALLGLTVALGAVAALSVASLYDVRRGFERELARSYAGEAAASALVSAGVVEETVLRAGGARPARTRAQEGFAAAAADARRAVSGDRRDVSLLSRAVAGQRALRRAGSGPARGRGAALRRAARPSARGRAAAVALADRQVQRRAEASETATGRSRRALIIAAVAGALAVLGAGALIAALVATLRRPLDALVGATSRLAAGDLDARVEPAGPTELRDLSGSFNSMAEGLQTAQRRIETARERLATVVTSLGDGLVLCSGHGVVEQVNPRAEQLLPELPPGTDLRRVEGPLPALDDALQREVEVDHGGRTLTVTAARLGADLTSGVVFTVRDSTERVQLERAKSDFVATASHELRSPLTSIKGFVELLAAADLPDRQKDFVDIVLVSTNRLVGLVNDLLDVARVEAGQLQIQPRPTNLGEVAADVAQLMHARFADRDQALSVDVEPDPPSAWADPERVRQILTNLVTNAHLYTPDGGEVEIRVHGDGDEVAVVVADTGRGMTAEQLEHAFDRFYRADGTTASGTGLGLPIVQSLVELHGGSVQLESVAGEGTTVTVRLPRMRGATEMGDLAEALRGRHVLVADDEPEVGRLVAELLTDEGVTVTAAHSGADALRKLRAGNFDAVTLDVLLGDRDGISVMEEIRADAALARLPIVVVSVRAGSDDLPSEWTVPKPIDPEALKAALGSAILVARARVLVIARPAVRDDVSEQLRARGLDAAWASDAEEAEALAAQRHFEIALVDHALGDADEVAADVALRGRRLHRHVVGFDADAGGSGGAIAAVMQALRASTGVGSAR